jgi:hypothetical protein
MEASRPLSDAAFPGNSIGSLQQPGFNSNGIRLEHDLIRRLFGVGSRTVQAGHVREVASHLHVIAAQILQGFIPLGPSIF